MSRVDVNGGADLLAIETRAYGDTIVMSLVGDLDIATAQSVRDALADVEATRPRRLIIDLRDLGFVDSSGLHLIVSVHEQCGRAGAPKLYLRPAAPEVQRTFQLTGLEERLPFLSAPGAH